MVINMIPKKAVVEGVNPFKKNDVTLISAHRGGAFLNPENTEKAFDHVILETTYADIIEIDIHKTKDNVYVINHDDTINRTGILEEKEEDPIYIKEHTLEELREYNLGINFLSRDNLYPYRNLSLQEAKNDGLTIMTLTDFLNKYKEKREFKLFIEIKETGEEAIKTADYLHALLSQEENKWYQNRTMIISFDDPVIKYIADTYRDMYVSPLGYNIVPYVGTAVLGVSSFYLPPYHGIQMQYSFSGINLARKDLIDIANQRNISTIYWTINDQKQMENLVRLGADVITTNAPDVLKEVIDKLNKSN